MRFLDPLRKLGISADAAKTLAAGYLPTLTPEQIEQELPGWLHSLSDAQFAAAMAVALREKHRRELEVLDEALRLTGGGPG